MKRFFTFSVFVLLLAPIGSPSAQLLNKKAPVIVGHYHLNVTSVDEHKKFWVDSLGGTAMKFGNADVIKFPDVLLFLRVQPPTGGTRGTTFDHIGFAVPNVPETTAKVVANGYKLTVGRELAGQAPPVPAAGGSAVYGKFSYLVGPDGVKVELVTSSESNAPPITHHHVHFVNKQYVEMQQWYMKVFDATLRPGQTDFFIGADLPGVGYMLNFFRWELEDNLVGTKGRAVDHVGFEVKNLEEFCQRLEAKGITLIQPYRKAPELNNIGTAVITDPWGTSIELTEGLDKVS
ncbi:MAG TPA: VOC family protein [Vicinamibacterales bacterium]|jgi:catechol 2,3-dioxygenase-like lactoylglutathione lyase family enzyme